MNEIGRLALFLFRTGYVFQIGRKLALPSESSLKLAAINGEQHFNRVRTISGGKQTRTARIADSLQGTVPNDRVVLSELAEISIENFTWNRGVPVHVQGRACLS